MSFKCIHCGREVSINAVGTKHRNHCPYCLWSKHVDNMPGDREALCGGAMEPVGLTSKKEQQGLGELMIVHRCQKCQTESKNRLAGDDDSKTVLEVFENSLGSDKSLFPFLAEADRREIMIQLYGRAYTDAHMPS